MPGRDPDDLGRRPAAERGDPARRGLIEEGLSRLGIEAEEWQRAALERYLDELELWNRKRGLVNAEGRELVVRHLFDSLSGLAVVRRELEWATGRGPADTSPPRPTARQAAPGRPARQRSAPPTVFDLGSGGGFPGIPLSVFLPTARVSLVERSRSKCAFLKSARAVAGFRNTTVSCCSAEELETTADVVVFRALCAVDGERARMLAGLLRPGGAVVAYKGTWESVAPEAEAARESFGEVELIPVEVPMLSEERYLLVLRSSRASS